MLTDADSKLVAYAQDTSTHHQGTSTKVCGGADNLSNVGLDIRARLIPFFFLLDLYLQAVYRQQSCFTDRRTLALCGNYFGLCPQPDSMHLHIVCIMFALSRVGMRSGALCVYNQIRLEGIDQSVMICQDERT